MRAELVDKRSNASSFVRDSRCLGARTELLYGHQLYGHRIPESLHGKIARNLEAVSSGGNQFNMGKGKDQARVDAKGKRVRESGKTSVFKKGQKNDSVAAYDEATIKRLAAAYEGWQETWDCPRQGCGCLLSSTREAVPRSATTKHCTEIPSVI